MMRPRQRIGELGKCVSAPSLKHENRRPAAVTVLAMTGFFALPMLAIGQVIETYPQPPAISVDMQGTEKVGTDHEFTNPFLPPLTTSRDHRVGLVRKVHEGKAIFHLIAPEQMSAPLFDAGDGATMLASATLEQEVDSSEFFDGVGKISHLMMCDPLEDSSASPPILTNPVAGCGDLSGTNVNDCYDMYVIAGVITGDPPQLRLFSTPVRIEIEHPKEFDLSDPLDLREAKIVDIEVNPSHMGSQMIGSLLGGLDYPNSTKSGGIPTFHTPMLAGVEQRLLLVRFGFGSYISWDETLGSNSDHQGTFDPVYAVAPEDSSNHPCDPDNWTNFKPLSFAPQDEELEYDDTDPNAVDDFDFAKQDFRQPDGQLINPVGTLPVNVKDIPGRYVWMDQAAKNVFFGSLSQPLLDHEDACNANPAVCETLYTVSCVSGSGCTEATDRDSEGTAPHQGWMMMGAWTHGKMVLLDSQVNHTDFGLRLEEEHHRLVKLYRDPALGGVGPNVDVQVGSGRDDRKFAGSPYGYIDTTVQFGSMENFLNLHPKTFPRTPRDVVWQISAISRSDEIAFDDLTSQRTLIFSPMNAVKDMRNGNGSKYYDGVSHSEMRLQNAATSTIWDTPSYGFVDAPSATEGRIEHVALGGIKGRGFYLYPDTRINYNIPNGTGMADKEWLVSIFIDPREVPSHIRRLITLPSGAYVDLHGVRKIRVCGSIGGCTSMDLAKRMYEGSWSHLAFHIKPGTFGSNPEVNLYQDGFLFERLSSTTAGFAIGQGDLRVGSPTATPPTNTSEGAEGWIDELKVVEGPFSPEEICNHARGTLVAVPHDYMTTAPTCPAGETCLDDLLAPFENETLGRESVHKALHGSNAVVGAKTDHYICQIDYGSHLGVSLADPGDSLARSLRRRLLFPEGPLYWDESRPASVSNNFCLSCHESSSPVAGLKLAALTLDSTKVAEADPRRQPMQAPKFMEGRIPADYFGEFKPLTSRDGALESIDQYLNDGALFRWTFDEAGGTSASNWVLGRPGHSSGDATLMGDASFTDGVVKTGSTARGHAVDLDGVDDYVKVDDVFDIKNGDLTLAGWFKPELPGIGGDYFCQPFTNGKKPCTLIAKSGAGTHALWSMRVFHNGTDWQVQFKVSTGSAGPFQSLGPVLDVDLQTAGVQFDETAWHHLAGVYSASDGVMEVYLDGELLASKVASNISLASSSTHGVTIGSRLNSGGSPLHEFKGQLDDVQVFSRRLWDWEIEEIYETTP